MANYHALRLFKTLCLFFLTKLPGLTFIPCSTSILNSRVLSKVVFFFFRSLFTKINPFLCKFRWEFKRHWSHDLSRWISNRLQLTTKMFFDHLIMTLSINESIFSQEMYTKNQNNLWVLSLGRHFVDCWVLHCWYIDYRASK